VENNRLIRCFLEHQNKGPANECIQYQPVFHKKLIYLATIANACPTSTSKAVE
jgi:hypothetical protein